MVDSEAVSEALTHAVHARDEQSTRLDLFRSRALSLLGAVTIGGSFIAVVGQESKNGFDPWIGLGALVAFVIQFGFTFYVLYPFKNLTFSFRPDWLYHRSVDDEMALVDLQRRLLRGAMTGVASNDVIIDKVGKAYSRSQIAFLAAVLLSVVAVVAGG